MYPFEKSEIKFRLLLLCSSKRTRKLMFIYHFGPVPKRRDKVDKIRALVKNHTNF